MDHGRMDCLFVSLFVFPKAEEGNWDWDWRYPISWGKLVNMSSKQFG